MKKHITKTQPDMICACGPMEMLKTIGKLAKSSNIACQVSIETVMACGMGACLGCAVESTKTDQAYLHACVNGPVFNANELKFYDESPF